MYCFIKNPHWYFSDGGGRSGVYLAVDANMELAEEENCFDIYRYLRKLRQSRKGLVDNIVSDFRYVLFLNKYRICQCLKKPKIPIS